MQLRKTLCSNGTTWRCVSTISNPRHGLSNGNVILLLSCFLPNDRAFQDLPFLFLINFPVSFDNNVIFLGFIRFQGLQPFSLIFKGLFFCPVAFYLSLLLFSRFTGNSFFLFLFNGPLCFYLFCSSTTNFPFLLCFFLFSALINNVLFSRPYKQFSFFLFTFFRQSIFSLSLWKSNFLSFTISVIRRVLLVRIMYVWNCHFSMEFGCKVFFDISYPRNFSISKSSHTYIAPGTFSLTSQVYATFFFFLDSAVSWNFLFLWNTVFDL